MNVQLHPTSSGGIMNSSTMSSSSGVELIAMHPYDTSDPSHLSFPARAILTAKAGQEGNPLWFGSYKDQEGWFPPSYCRLQRFHLPHTSPGTTNGTTSSSVHMMQSLSGGNNKSRRSQSYDLDDFGGPLHYHYLNPRRTKSLDHSILDTLSPMMAQQHLLDHQGNNVTHNQQRPYEIEVECDHSQTHNTHDHHHHDHQLHEYRRQESSTSNNMQEDDNNCFSPPRMVSPSASTTDMNTSPLTWPSRHTEQFLSSCLQQQQRGSGGDDKQPQPRRMNSQVRGSSCSKLIGDGSGRNTGAKTNISPRNKLRGWLGGSSKQQAPTPPKTEEAASSPSKTSSIITKVLLLKPKRTLRRRSQEFDNTNNTNRNSEQHNNNDPPGPPVDNIYIVTPPPPSSSPRHALISDVTMLLPGDRASVGSTASHSSTNDNLVTSAEHHHHTNTNTNTKRAVRFSGEQQQQQKLEEEEDPEDPIEIWAEAYRLRMKKQQEQLDSSSLLLGNSNSKLEDMVALEDTIVASTGGGSSQQQQPQLASASW